MSGNHDDNLRAIRAIEDRLSDLQSYVHQVKSSHGSSFAYIDQSMHGVHREISNLEMELRRLNNGW